MSEIKGQLFGILLVIMVFAAVGGILVTAFVNASKNVAEKIEKEPELVSTSSGYIISYPNE